MHKTVVVGLIYSEGSVLLVRQAYGNHLWTLPGGVVEPGETLAKAVGREVREETGLETRVRGLVSLRDDADQTCLVFTMQVCGGKLVDSVPGEIEATRWFTFEEVETAGPTIEQFPHFIVSQAFRSDLTMLRAQLWNGYSGLADLFVG